MYDMPVKNKQTYKVIIVISNEGLLVHFLVLIQMIREDPYLTSGVPWFSGAQGKK